MTNSQLNQIRHFVTHTGMYIQPVDRENIISLITGFEIGTDSQFYFTKILGNHIQEKFQIPATSLGWPDQVHRYSQARGIDWLASCKELVLETLDHLENFSTL